MTEIRIDNTPCNVSLFIQRQLQIVVDDEGKNYYFAVFMQGICLNERYMMRHSHNYIIHNNMIAQRTTKDKVIIWPPHFSAWKSDVNIINNLTELCDRYKSRLDLPPKSCCCVM